MLYDNPSRANTPSLPPSPSLEIIVLPPSSPPVSPDRWEVSSWAPRPQTPHYSSTSYNTAPLVPESHSIHGISAPQRSQTPRYSSTSYSTAPLVPESHSIHGTSAPQPLTEPRDSNYSTPYNTAPIFPRSLSVHGTPASRSHPEPLGLDYPAPPSLPTTPRMPQATLGWPPPTPTTQTLSDLGYSRPLRGTPWAPPATNRVQAPMGYLHYIPYNTAANTPPSPSVHSAPTSRSRPEPPGSYYLEPSALPATPGMSQATLGGSPTSSTIQVSADYTRYPSLLHGASLTPPEVMPPPNGVQAPINYPYYPSTPYNPPFTPPIPSVHNSPTSRSPLGSYHPEPSALSVTPDLPETTLHGPPAAPTIQVPAYFTGYLTLHGLPWALPQGMSHPNTMSSPPWPGRHPATSYNTLNQFLPPMFPSVGPFMPAATPWPLHPGMSPYVAYNEYAPWQRPAQQPHTIRIPGNPGDTARVDHIDLFAEGPHYGPVLEPFLARIVDAAIKVNPLLAPSNTQDDYLRWDMLFHWHTSNRYQMTEWLNRRNSPATHPRLSHIQIISRAFPWMIHVSALDPKLGVTCGEVLDAISTHMHGHVGKKECEHLPADRKRQMWESYRFNRSTDPNVPGGHLGGSLKRLDLLGRASKFGGLVANEAFVKEYCGDALPCTFELVCLQSRPLTTEQSRPENLARHRSRTWPWPTPHLSSSFGTDKGKQSMEGLSHSGATEPGETSAESSHYGRSRSHTVTSPIIGAGPNAPGQLIDTPAPTTGPPIRFNHMGEFSGFVNHSPHRVMYKNKLYPTALHLLEALKFTHQPALQERVRMCKDVRDMYPLSASFQEYVRPDWGQVFLKVVEDVLYLKFKQNPTLWALLLQTGLADIIYSDEDSFWGDGPSGRGANKLGKALVRLRERLRQEGDN